MSGYVGEVFMPAGKVVLRISGCDDRVVVWDEVNDKSVQLLRPNFYSQADCLYRYVLQHPNRDIARKEFEQEFERSFSQTLPALVSQLQFSGVLRRLFFRVSQSHVRFYNPVTWERMQKMEISMEDIAVYFLPKEQLFPLCA